MIDWQVAGVVMVVAFALLVRVMQPRPARRWHKRVEPEYQTAYDSGDVPGLYYGDAGIQRTEEPEPAAINENEAKIPGRLAAERAERQRMDDAGHARFREWHDPHAELLARDNAYWQGKPYYKPGEFDIEIGDIVYLQDGKK